MLSSSTSNTVVAACSSATSRELVLLADEAQTHNRRRCAEDLVALVFDTLDEIERFSKRELLPAIPSCGKSQATEHLIMSEDNIRMARAWPDSGKPLATRRTEAPNRPYDASGYEINDIIMRVATSTVGRHTFKRDRARLLAAPAGARRAVCRESQYRRSVHHARR